MHNSYALAAGSLNGQVLKLLATLIGARRILEIGTYTGYTALALAESLPENDGCLVCHVSLFKVV